MTTIPAHLKHLYPFQSHFLDLDGLQYHYLDEGRGPSVVMLHGNPTWSFFYRNAILQLKDICRIIVPDHMGCGLSSKPGTDRYPFTLERRVQDLENLLTHLNLPTPIHLLVHDWGGMIGTVFATRHPESIASLTLLNTAGFLLPQGKSFPKILTLTRSPMGRFLTLHLNAFCRGAARYCPRTPLPSPVRQMFLLPYDTPAHRLAVWEFVRDIPNHPSHRSYPTVKTAMDDLKLLNNTPMHIFWAGKDFIFDQSFLAEWQRRFPNATCHQYPDAGHYILEDAAQAIIPELRTIIQEPNQS